jgi:uncharacterized protein YndB with AHSA1/START domain
MSADRIEHELTIHAPIGVVWELITEPEHITAWFTDTVELELRPGARGRFGWTDKATSRAATVNVQVEELVRPHLFSFRWDFPDGADPDESNAPLVSFRLEEAGDSTRLTLVESGIAAVARSEEATAAYYADHEKGWPKFGRRLAEYAATAGATQAA